MNFYSKREPDILLSFVRFIRTKTLLKRGSGVKYSAGAARRQSRHWAPVLRAVLRGYWILASCLFCTLVACKRQTRTEAVLPQSAEQAGAADGRLLSATDGYVADEACAECHLDLYESYQEVGMARSFYTPTPENLIEDFENSHYYHAPSDQHFETVLRDGEIFQRRYQLDADGNHKNEMEVRVDAVIGSGNHIRSYVYRTPSGEMFQMPVAWYSGERKWRMNPGYDLPNHLGYQRKITRECMFCHNAYPLEAAPGADDHWQPHVFPAELPHGIGCQRCHGPGQRHVQVAQALPATDPAVRQTIVNPAHLTHGLQEDVCNQCHLQPSSQIVSEMVRDGRSEYSYRPGEPLGEYRALLDYADPRTSEERFEINHHPYRMRQSRCFLESDGGMNCLSCHDPHRKVVPSERLAHYRQACLRCHQVAQCSTAWSLEGEAPAGEPHRSRLADCTACHMPERRTHDVIHATMTDHKIVARPEPEATRLAPRREPAPPPTDAVPFSYQDSARGSDKHPMAVYVAMVGAQAGNDEQLEWLLQYVQKNKVTSVQVLSEIANAFRDRGAVEQELQTLMYLVENHPQHVQANLELAMALAAVGQHEQAHQYYRRALEIGPPLPETWVGLGMSMLNRGDVEQAEAHFREAVRLRPLYPEALLNLGIVLHAKGAWREAREMLLRARAADPSFIEANDYLESIPTTGDR